MSKGKATGRQKRRLQVLGGADGFSLVELLIAMAVGLVILAAMYSVFSLQNKTFGNQEELVALQETVRAGMDMIAREVEMAGYDPAGVNSDTNSSNNFSGITVDALQLQVQADLDGNGVIDSSSQENIIYAYDAGSMTVTRNIGAGAQTLLDNIEAFSFSYLNAADNVTATSGSVRQVQITITGRTSKPDPEYTTNDGYRTYTLTQTVVPRNLAY